MRLPFERSLEIARRRGFLKAEKKLRLALDTTVVLGQGAIKDTYNLLADGNAKLIRELAQQDGQKPQRWAEKRGWSRYFGSSIKGEAELDWSDPGQRNQFLKGLVEDAEQLLELARQARGRVPEGSRAERRLLAASQLLSQLLLQDVERKEEGEVAIRRGTSGERIPSVHDPEMRHGRKSGTVRFDGHKLGLAVDTEDQLITAVDIMAGGARDDADASDLVKSSAQATGCEVEQVLADSAYSSADNRLQFQALGVDLVAKVPRHGEHGFFSKDRFEIDIEAMSCSCPAGEVTANLVGHRAHRYFQFPAQICAACPLRAECYAANSKRGRQVVLHRHEEVLLKARARQRSPGFQQLWRRRQAVEHRVARMVQLGMRQARYRGRQKTLFQALLTAAVANLTLVATVGGPRTEPSGPCSRNRSRRQISGAVSTALTRLSDALTSILGSDHARPSALFLKPASRPDF